MEDHWLTLEIAEFPVLSFYKNKWFSRLASFTVSHFMKTRASAPVKPTRAPCLLSATLSVISVHTAGSGSPSAVSKKSLWRALSTQKSLNSHAQISPSAPARASSTTLKRESSPRVWVFSSNTLTSGVHGVGYATLFTSAALIHYPVEVHPGSVVFVCCASLCVCRMPNAFAKLVFFYARFQMS